MRFKSAEQRAVKLAHVNTLQILVAPLIIDIVLVSCSKLLLLEAWSSNNVARTLNSFLQGHYIFVQVALITHLSYVGHKKQK